MGRDRENQGKGPSVVSTTQNGQEGFRTMKDTHAWVHSNSTYILRIYYIQVPVLQTAERKKTHHMSSALMELTI